MAPSASTTSRPVFATFLGLIATLAIVGIHLCGLDGRIEQMVLDLRFATRLAAPRGDSIVQVHIDDLSIEQLGRWPWPRTDLAGIVEVLQECGARSVALDVILPDPQALRYESAVEDIYSPDSSEILGQGPPLRVFDDAAMAETLRRHANISLPMHIDIDFTGDGTVGPAPWPVDKAAAAYMKADPNRPFRLFEKFMRQRKGPRRSLAELGKTYLRLRALNAVGDSRIAPEQLAGYPLEPGWIAPPMVQFARQVRHTGFVTFEPDSDGVARRIPLLAADAGDVADRADMADMVEKVYRSAYPQFALSLAADELARRHGGTSRITADASAVTIRCSDGTTVRIPVDADGFLLINWAPSERYGQVSAAEVGDVDRRRRGLARRKNVLRHHQLALMGMVFGRPVHSAKHPLVKLFQRAEELHARRVAQEVRRQQMALYEPDKTPPSLAALLKEEAEAEAAIDRGFEELLGELDFFLAGRTPADKKEIADRIALLSRMPAEDEEIRKQITEDVQRLRRRIEGKLCIVGSSATGAADFVPTPLHRRTPGMTVHANIVNTILTGAFVGRTGWLVNVLVIFLAGGAVSLLTATRPVFHQAFPLTAALAAALTAVNVLIVFGVWHIWMTLVAPLAAMAASLLVVTAYRQLTEERARKRVRGMFAHALSPALVDRLMEDPSLARLGGERRRLSCVFADLADFTALSERMGEQRTVRILNEYFDYMTQVIQSRNGGYINKFLGDGLLVFFGAPVVQEDHAARAVRAAIETVRDLDSVNEALEAEHGMPIGLLCRIGVATGDVMVGNCGSTDRIDYTAIGDTVNLSSRLVSANKAFGTITLIDDDTLRESKGGGVLARPLGKILVVGKKEPVTVWDVMGPEDQSEDWQKQAAADFGPAIELFQRREFAAAAGRFQDILTARPDDKAATLYADLSRQYAASPPDDDWAGAVQLMEK